MAEHRRPTRCAVPGGTWSLPGESDRRGGALGEFDDRDGPAISGCLSSVGDEGGEYAVAELGESSLVMFVTDDGCQHRDSSQRDLGVGTEVVEPARMMWCARIGGDDDHTFAVVEIDHGIPPELARSGAPGFEQRCSDHQGGRESILADAQQNWVESPVDSARQPSGRACGCEHGEPATEEAGRARRRDDLQLSGHRGRQPRGGAPRRVWRGRGPQSPLTVGRLVGTARSGCLRGHRRGPVLRRDRSRPRCGTEPPLR
jgi:hypothetical protein